MIRKRDCKTIISSLVIVFIFSLMPLFVLPYKRFAFTSYTNDNYRLLPKLYKLRNRLT